MAIELNEALTLAQAARELPRLDGKRPHPSTLWRWARKGLRGVRLEYCRLGRRVVTSRAALTAFAAALAAADTAPAAPTPPREPPRDGRSANRKAQDVARADARLRKAGA